MKFVSALLVIALLIAVSGCNSASSSPRHTVDEVTAIAKTFSPKCLKEIPPSPEACG